MVRIVDVGGQGLDPAQEVGVAAFTDLDEERVQVALVGAGDQGVDLLGALEPLVEAVDPEGAVLGRSIGMDHRFVGQRGGSGLGTQAGDAAADGRGDWTATGAEAALQATEPITRRGTRSPRLRDMRGIMPPRAGRWPSKAW